PQQASPDPPPRQASPDPPPQQASPDQSPLQPAVRDHGRDQSVGNTTGPSDWTSGSRSIPNRSFTRRRPSAISAITSAVVASPWFSMKLACFAEKLAPPMRKPRQPAASSS